jgi:hypothetical protein
MNSNQMGDGELMKDDKANIFKKHVSFDDVAEEDFI